MYKNVYLKNKKEQSLQRFHPWVFSGAIARSEGPLSEGETVRVLTAGGDFLAVGHYQSGSIAVRVLSFQDCIIDTGFWLERLSAAYALRRTLRLTENSEHNIFRLVHGEGDRLPGLIVDVYGSTAVVQAHSVGMHLARKAIAEALLSVLKDRVAHIYYKSDTTLPVEPMPGEENGYLTASADTNVALEYGLKFHIDWLKGQKTGFFIDQRENRHLLEHYAAERSVLNMFCYTGGFSVYALRGGAHRVVSVDSSAKAIDITQQNVELNFGDETRHTAVAEDAFRYLDQMEMGQYDLIVLDPPAFAKHREAIRNALKGYTRLNRKAIEKIKRGGLLFTFSCSQAITKEQFRLAVFTAAAEAHRAVKILHQLHQPADHPINIFHPEGEYLKGLVLYVE